MHSVAFEKENKTRKVYIANEDAIADQTRKREKILSRQTGFMYF